MRTLLDDLRYAIRGLRRSPGFVVVVASTLAVAIGLNTAVFTVADAVLFKGFRGVERNDRLVYIGTQQRGRGCCASFPDYLDWRAQAKSFTGLGAVADLQVVVADDGGAPEHADATRITTNGFRLLGQHPVIGRDFTESDGMRGAAPVAILQYGFWGRRYGHDPSIVGQRVRINGAPTTIIGVMPSGFSFPQNQDLWIPLVPGADLENRSARALWFAFGRLADHASLDSARADLATIGRRLEAAYPLTNEGWVPTPRTFTEFFVGRDAVLIYGVLWGAVAFVALIGCANLANVVLSRGLDRAQELAVLAAIGASRARIVRQAMMESLILSAIGAGVGWWIAAACVRAYELIANPSARLWSAHLLDFRMDARALVYTLLASCATTLLFGLGPAIYLSAIDANGTLKDAHRSVAGSWRGRRLSNVVIGCEMALAIVLLAGAGVMIRSFVNMATADIGVRVAGTDGMLISLPRDRYATAQAQTAFFDRFVARVSTSPEIAAVTVADELPAANGRRLACEREGDAPLPAERRDTVTAMTIGSRYFETLGATLRSGRDFTRFDTPTAPAVAIVNEKFAETRWPGADPIGKRVRVFDAATPGPWLTVVGVASNIVQNVADRQAQDAIVYRPYWQRPTPWLWVVVRHVPGVDVSQVVRREITAIDPDLPFWIGPLTLDALLAAMGNYWLLGNQAMLLGVFGLVALMLASIGVYSVIAYSVRRRTKEIGIRLAIGATRRRVVGLVVFQGIWPLGLGCASGLVAWLALMAIVRSQLVRVSPADPVTLAAVSGLLVICGLVGCIVPAAHAARIDPASAIRHD